MPKTKNNPKEVSSLTEAEAIRFLERRGYRVEHPGRETANPKTRPDTHHPFSIFDWLQEGRY